MVEQVRVGVNAGEQADAGLANQLAVASFESTVLPLAEKPDALVEPPSIRTTAVEVSVSPAQVAAPERPATHPVVSEAGITLEALAKVCPYWAGMKQESPELARSQFVSYKKAIEEESAMRRQGASEQDIKSSKWATGGEQFKQRAMAGASEDRPTASDDRQPSDALVVGREEAQRLEPAEVFSGQVEAGHSKGRTPLAVETSKNELTPVVQSPESIESPNEVYREPAETVVAQPADLAQESAPASLPDDFVDAEASAEMSQLETVVNPVISSVRSTSAAAKSAARLPVLAQVEHNAIKTVNSVTSEVPQNRIETAAKPVDDPKIQLRQNRESSFETAVPVDQLVDVLDGQALLLSPAPGEAAGELSEQSIYDSFAAALQLLSATTTEKTASTIKTVDLAELTEWGAVKSQEVVPAAPAVLVDKLIESKTEPVVALTLEVAATVEAVRLVSELGAEPVDSEIVIAARAKLEVAVAALFERFDIDYSDSDVDSFVTAVLQPDFVAALLPGPDADPVSLDLERAGTHEAKKRLSAAATAFVNGAEYSLEKLLGVIMLTSLVSSQPA